MRTNTAYAPVAEWIARSLSDRSRTCTTNLHLPTDVHSPRGSATRTICPPGCHPRRSPLSRASTTTSASRVCFKASGWSSSAAAPAWTCSRTQRKWGPLARSPRVDITTRAAHRPQVRDVQRVALKPASGYTNPTTTGRSPSEHSHRHHPQEPRNREADHQGGRQDLLTSRTRPRRGARFLRTARRRVVKREGKTPRSTRARRDVRCGNGGHLGRRPLLGAVPLR